MPMLKNRVEIFELKIQFSDEFIIVAKYALLRITL